MNTSPSPTSHASGADAPPARIGRYEIEAELGRGATGIVYRARDPIIDRVLAIKIVDPRLCGEALDLHVGTACPSSFRERFFGEVRAAGKLNHPGIVTIYDAGEADGVPYIAMELLEGATLRDLLCGEPLPVERALDVAMQLANALASAHEAGVVHRDVKPENVMVAGRRRVKLGDFGIANVMRAPGVRDDPAGSPKYMSPEQARGEDVDARSDVFSLGVVLYEMLTAVQPFAGTETREIVRQVMDATPMRPSARDPLVPAEVDALVMQMLAKDADARVESARQLYRELQRRLKACGAEIDERDERDDDRRSIAQRETNGHDEATPAQRRHDPRAMHRADPFAWRRPALAGVLVGVLLASAVAIASLGEQRLADASVMDARPAAKPEITIANVVRESAMPLPASAPGPLSASASGPEAPETPPLTSSPTLAVAAASPPKAAPSRSRADFTRKARSDHTQATPPRVTAPKLEPVLEAAAAVSPAKPDSGTVRLAISPWGELFVDGKFHGMTPPIDALELPPGRHRLEIRNSLLPTYVADVRLDAGDTKHIRHRFE